MFFELQIWILELIQLSILTAKKELELEPQGKRIAFCLLHYKKGQNSFEKYSKCSHGIILCFATIKKR